MDLLTQGVLGAAMAQATRRNTKHVGIAGACGFLAGMAPDLDAFIRSPSDPLIFLEYHRHFTHSLFFIPIGGLLTAVCIYFLSARRWQLTFLETFLYCTMGYATHGVLDATTSYGTSLLWPFSQDRISWSLISIVDPLFTVPLAGLVALAIYKRKPLHARVGLFWVALYLSIALLQQQAAVDMAKEIAAERGHIPIRITAKPSFGNILVWRTIYELPEDFYIDAVRVGFAPKVFEGTTLPKLVVDRDLPWLAQDSQQDKDIKRFRFFSLGFVAQNPERPNRLIDIRYSFVPNDIQALWSIEASPSISHEAHVTYQTHREDARNNLSRLWEMVTEE